MQQFAVPQLGIIERQSGLVHARRRPTSSTASAAAPGHFFGEGGIHLAQGMAREGELFVSLKLTIEESRRNGGCYQYQQVVVNSLIQEFGTEVRVIFQIPPPVALATAMPSNDAMEVFS
jgi:hypothetical protein